MFNRLLQHIQQQPRSTRETYAFAGAVFTTLVVGLLWAGQLTVNPDSYIHTANVSQVNDEVSQQAESQPSNPPFSALWKQLKSLFGGTAPTQTNFSTKDSSSVNTQEKVNSGIEYIENKDSEAVDVVATSSEKRIQVVPTE